MVFSRRCARVGFLALAGFVPIACGGGGSGAPFKGPAIGAEGVPFDRKSHQEKADFMAAHVQPTMGRLFRSHDAKSYGDFGCVTCHGSDMESVDFRMPNSLYALPAEDTIAEAEDYDQEMTAFMVKEVVPTFARLLHEKPGEPGGVTCFTCHPKE